jgi:hypothetical protein
MTTAYTKPAVVQPKSGLGSELCIEGWDDLSMQHGGRVGRRFATALIALPPMTTTASESTPQRIATIREQLKLLGDYL